MSDLATLLIEIGTEELPPKSLKKLAESLSAGIGRRLQEAQVIESVEQVSWYAAPRRLAVSVAQVASRQPDQQIEKRGPAIKAAWDDQGEPTKATQGFARSCGVAPQQLETLSTDKGEWLVYRNLQPGSLTADLVPEMVLESVRQLPIDRRMRWGAGEGEFVRPVHWLVALLGSEIIEFELFGVAAGDSSRGHRFHANHPISLANAESYLSQLRDAHVIADYAERQQLIVDQVEAVARQAGGSAVLEPALLDEVTSLVEWPQAVIGGFDQQFLQVPAEALVASMGDHQKYFHLLDADRKLLPHFITVSNLDCAHSSLIAAGNERVLRARLADARFFWETDLKRDLTQLAEGLSAVTFQQKLGTMAQKAERLVGLTAAILTASASDLDAALGVQAATLCKADLLSDMVGEFPKLQGVMGQYYADAQGLDPHVGEAIREHYLPRFAGDELPATELGAALALADRVDTLVGIFAIGAIPSGDKDPFALRRAALGVLRIQLEYGLDLPLQSLLEQAVAELPEALRADSLVDQVRAFILDRYRGYAEAGGYAHDEIEAVLAINPQQLGDAQTRLSALQQFRGNPAARSLAAANKRVANILGKSALEGVDQVDKAQLVEPEELALYEALQDQTETVARAIDSQDYLGACTQLAGLREAVDGFFDAVMVMADDDRLRNNRLALLRQMRELFLQVADFSFLQG
ncbi:MAG: glycine--tRNA ligase subunit beta, partial [Gammaproteobacteria bacterium]